MHITLVPDNVLYALVNLITPDQFKLSSHSLEAPKAIIHVSELIFDLPTYFIYDV